MYLCVCVCLYTIDEEVHIIIDYRRGKYIYTNKSTIIHKSAHVSVKTFSPDL